MHAGHICDSARQYIWKEFQRFCPLKPYSMPEQALTWNASFIAWIRHIQTWIWTKFWYELGFRTVGGWLHEESWRPSLNLSIMAYLGRSIITKSTIQKSQGSTFLQGFIHLLSPRLTTNNLGPTLLQGTNHSKDAWVLTLNYFMTFGSCGTDFWNLDLPAPSFTGWVPLLVGVGPVWFFEWLGTQGIHKKIVLRDEPCIWETWQILGKTFFFLFLKKTLY